MSFLANLFRKKGSTDRGRQTVKPRPGICMVCGKTGLKLITEYVYAGCKLDEVGLECVRCGGHICRDCFGKLPKHADGFGILCPACNKYSIFEQAGHHCIPKLAREAEAQYGK